MTLLTPPEPFTELYLSEDILQGERVPFYLVWRNADVVGITIHCHGFRRLVSLYNVVKFDRTGDGVTFPRDQLKLDGYVGGVLSTPLGPTATEEGTLQVHLDLRDGSTKVLSSQRTLYSVRAKLSHYSDRISLPLPKGEHPIRIVLSGAATASIEITQMPLSLPLGVPIEVASAMQRYAGVIKEGLEDLKAQFPEYDKFLSRITDEKLANSLSKYNRVMMRYLKKYKKNEELMQSLAYLFVSAILEQESIRGILLLPLIEYFESSAAVKAFLETPLLAVDVPSGGGRLRCKIVLHDLLNHQCGRPIVIDTQLDSKGEILLQLKDLIRFERI